VKVDTERAAAAIGAMDRTGTATLRSTAAQARRQPQVLQHLSDRQLLLHMSEVDEGPLPDGIFGWYSGGTDCGDHFPRRLCLGLVARSLVLCCLLLGRLFTGSCFLSSRAVGWLLPGVMPLIERLVA